MPEYVCRKDGHDLSAEVRRAIQGKGGDLLGFVALVESRSAEGHVQGEFLAAAAQEDEDIVPVVVICPRDDVENIFYVRRSAS